MFCWVSYCTNTNLANLKMKRTEFWKCSDRSNGKLNSFRIIFVVINIYHLPMLRQLSNSHFLRFNLSKLFASWQYEENTLGCWLRCSIWQWKMLLIYVSFSKIKKINQNSMLTGNGAINKRVIRELNFFYFNKLSKARNRSWNRVLNRMWLSVAPLRGHSESS